MTCLSFTMSQEWFPLVPEMSGHTPSAEALAGALSFKTLELALPRLKLLNPKQILELRNETSHLTSSFRREMMRLSWDLAQALSSNVEPAEVAEEANRLIKARVLPPLEELSAELRKPAKPWYEWAIGPATSASSIVAGFTSLPANYAAAGALGGATLFLVDLLRAQQTHRGRRSSPLTYLIEIDRKLK